MKNIAISPGCEVEITATTGSTGKPGAYSGFVKTEITAPRVTASGAKVLCSSLAWVAAGCTNTISNFNFTAGAGAIMASATKFTSDGLKPMREDDTGSCAGSFVDASTPPKTVVCNCSVKIKKAGQTKAGAT